MFCFMHQIQISTWPSSYIVLFERIRSFYVRYQLTLLFHAFTQICQTEWKTWIFSQALHSVIAYYIIISANFLTYKSLQYSSVPSIHIFCRDVSSSFFFFIAFFLLPFLARSFNLKFLHSIFNENIFIEFCCSVKRRNFWVNDYVLKYYIDYIDIL